MANTNANATNLQWGGGAGVIVALNTNARFLSDIVSVNADAVQGVLLVSVTNGGTPASGDTVDAWVTWSPDNSTFETDEHAQFLGRLDTFSTNDPGENPARKMFPLNVSGKRGFKVVLRANQGASRTVSAFAVYNEHRMS